MLYYKIKASADQRQRKDGSFLIANELYTQKEAERFKINPAYYDKAEASKRKVYFFFGCRFAD